MKPLLLAFALIALFSCKKSVDPPKTCCFITDKYLFNGSTPYFEIGESVLGDGTRLQVSETDYNTHQIGAWYCY